MEDIARFDSTLETGSDSTVRHRDDGERPSRSVVELVSEVTGTDARTLDPLFDVVDPDALDELFDRGSTSDRTPRSGYVQFRYNDCEVAVHADGRTVVLR